MGISKEQFATWQDRSARQDLPLLDEVVPELESLVRAMFTPPITYQLGYSADIMVLSFATKQLEHLRSVRALIAAGSHRDAQLIARTMLEAQGRLLWAFRQVPERPDLWFRYGAILDWRQLAKNKRAGVVVDPADEALLKPYVDQYGSQYYRPKVRQRQAEAERDGTTYLIPDDPWDHNDWTETNVRSMFEELGDVRLYDSFYRRTSEWAHSGPRAVLGAADPQQAGPDEWGPDQFTDDDVVAGAWALGMACESLYRCLDELNKHFALGYNDRLDEVGERLNALFAVSLASAP